MSDVERDLLNAAPAGFLSFRDDGYVTVANDTLLDLLGYARDDVVGRHIENLMGVAARIFFQTHLFPLVRLHGRADEIYMALRDASGTAVPVLLNARRLMREAEDPVTHCVLVRVQERKKYEDELLRAKREAEEAHAEARSANQAKSHYLQSVSHEIRTPINAVLGYADLLELHAGSPIGEEQLRYIERVRHSARHLLSLVNDVLDLAKIESGAMNVHVEPAQLERAVDAALSVVEPQARERQIDLVAEPRATPVSYRGDHERVVQILLNLLSNAVKFTDSGGRVELAWRHVDTPRDPTPPRGGSGPWLAVSVSDTGIGIPPDGLGDLFQPFKQIDAPGRDHPTGTGLGLSISREFARLMGGDITVRSTPGTGSTFTLWLKPVA